MRDTVRKRVRKLLCILLFLFAAVLFCYFENHAITVTEYRVEDHSLPASFDGTVILHISDLHNKTFGKQQDELIRKMEQEKPDLIVITGDLVDSNHPDVEAAAVFVKKAVRLAPVYFVTGNHDNWLSDADTEALYRCLDEAGVLYLKDEVRVLARGESQIYLLGLDDDTLAFPSKLRETLAEMEQEIAQREKAEYPGRTKPADAEYPERTESADAECPETFQILLAHEPQLFDYYADSDVNLVLCGHAHGGQFRIPFIGGFVAPDQGFLPTFTEGMHEKNSTRMIISRGLGNSVVPQRLLNRPELVKITLYHK